MNEMLASLKTRNARLEAVLAEARRHTTHLACTNDGGMTCKYCQLREAIRLADATPDGEGL